MTTLERTNLIIIDDWGPEPLTAEQRRDLLEIVDDRYDKGSLLITSQVLRGAPRKTCNASHIVMRLSGDSRWPHHNYFNILGGLVALITPHNHDFVPSIFSTGGRHAREDLRFLRQWTGPGTVAA
jgi:IstB-like ATP binding protein